MVSRRDPSASSDLERNGYVERLGIGGFVGSASIGPLAMSGSLMSRILGPAPGSLS
jgi:hypothetical protein